MSTVLALETDDGRIDFLRVVVCEQLRASLVVAYTSEAAVSAISAGMPDVVLVSPDFPPREEIEIKDYLRSLRRSDALEIIKMPSPSHCAPRARTHSGLLGALRRLTASASVGGRQGDDAAVLAGCIADALDRVRDARVPASLQAAPQATPERAVTREPDPGVRTAADRPEPESTPHAPEPDERAGGSVSSSAAPADADLVCIDVADRDQDEWGLYDPDHCGYAALAATLGALPGGVQPNGEPSPADMLLKLETPASARRERRRDQPAPLALWAHLFG